MPAAPCWAGVDVGGRRKGFDLAVIDRERVVGGPTRIGDAAAAVAWLREQKPAVVAVDSPRRRAPAGALSRPDERLLVAAKVCGIRYTPNAEALAANEGYYEWIQRGFDLYAALTAGARWTRWQVIECFPTATWTRLGGPKGARSRARWSREVLADQPLTLPPKRLGQDARDAIGAALTARAFADGATESFGDLVVPRPI